LIRTPDLGKENSGRHQTRSDRQETPSVWSPRAAFLPSKQANLVLTNPQVQIRGQSVFGYQVFHQLRVRTSFWTLYTALIHPSRVKITNHHSTQHVAASLKQHWLTSIFIPKTYSLRAIYRSRNWTAKQLVFLPLSAISII